MKVIILLFSFYLLVSCTSQPLDVRYYNLYTANKPVDFIAKEKLETIILLPIMVADYLKPTNLVIQLDKHQLYYSPTNMWAEDLSSDFHKALIQDLNNNSHYNFRSKKSVAANTAKTHILIELEHFHSTGSSKAVVSGVYSIYNKKNHQGIINKGFYFELELVEDGFTHSVLQLRNLVTLTAKLVESDTSFLLK
ncbi:membrane integrity-associated transporter subunit PqiC [Paraglaciecola sp. L3A3]|uniref:PqiC family protein n=1 Tax=Paraglaciecola sp. L3A3 TaxID=2686358 RepID=UPI00131CA4EB|nr:ABC-type transport auxiliary lipoprotein family protein [Paraglaciecola sp. L3A3]